MQLCLLQRNFRAALSQYTEALSLAHHTEGANAIRLGIGICHISLGDLNLARVAFERVFSQDESSAEALVGLAAVDLLAPEGTIERFCDLLTAAYRLDPHSSALNNALAQFNLVSGNLVAAESYAQVAVRLLFTFMFPCMHPSLVVSLLKAVNTPKGLYNTSESRVSNVHARMHFLQLISSTDHYLDIDRDCEHGRC